MNHITKSATNKNSRKRVISSLKKFNKLLDAESRTIDDHYLTKGERLHIIDSCLFDCLRGDWADDYFFGSITCSSKHGDIRRLNDHFEYIKKCFQMTTSREPLNPSFTDDLLWIGGEDEEVKLARLLGISEVIIRRYYEPFGGATYHDVISATKGQFSFPRWVLIIDNSSGKRRVRFDYVCRTDHKERVIFSRYFVSPNDLIDLVYKPFQREKAIEQKKLEQARQEAQKKLNEIVKERTNDRAEGLYAKAQRLLSRSKLEAIDLSVKLPEKSDEVSND